MPDGRSEGFDGPVRQVVSRASTVTAKILFGRTLKRVTDPMTGFFAVKREEIQVDQLAKTRGFKVVLRCSSVILTWSTPRSPSIPPP